MSESPSQRLWRGSLATLLAFGVGLPLGLALVTWVLQYADAKAPADSWPALIDRYVAHPVEQAEFVLFFCALGALLGKWLSNLNERAVLRGTWLPEWDGKAQPVASAKELLYSLERQPGRVRQSLLGKRLAAVLDFVRSRGSANELDDQLRCLADNDGLALDNSYSLMRFITWAIPILGFLGTVLGITQAIAGVEPDKLEQSLSQVTGGLATAFDTTALALALTMFLMFVSFLTEQLEQSALGQVDQYVDEHLAHRFERVGTDNHLLVETLRQNTSVLLQATQQLVERQAEVWAKSLQKVDHSWTETAQMQQSALQSSLGELLERTVQSHGQRLKDLEGTFVAQTKPLLDHLYQLAVVVHDSSRQQQEALVQVAERIQQQTGVLVQLQEGEGQLLQLQQSLQNNLAMVTATGTFDQAVQSLTAAIHLLTTRLNTPTPAAPRLSKAA